MIPPGMQAATSRKTLAVRIVRAHDGLVACPLLLPTSGGSNMEPNAPLHTTDRRAHRPIQIVLVRANGPMFYSVAAASLLESIAPLYAQRLLYLARGNEALARWVSEEWLPQKAARARVLQD